MSWEPYLMDRFMGCYKASLTCPSKQNDPTLCTLDKYTTLFRDRWNVLRQDPCKKRLEQQKQQSTALNNDVCCQLTSLPLTKIEETTSVSCVNPRSWGNGQTQYQMDYKFSRSHNTVDDCCSSPCPCEDGLPNYCRDSKNSAYAPLQQWQPPCPPMESVTSYQQYYHPHPVQPRLQRPPEQLDPCGFPLEECTTTRADYTRKDGVPIGPAHSQIIKHGLWSCKQFNKEFTDVTTNQLAHPKKCVQRPPPVHPPLDNFCIPSSCPLRTDTETSSQFFCKSDLAEPTHCTHAWLDNENWHPPETPMDTCTTYNHFYKFHPVPSSTKSTAVDSPDAIPFCSINGLCYSCHDPEPDQRTPVELKDNDPWPFVKPSIIRYQDNLQLDSCAPFRDETTQKIDYTPKTLCRPNSSFAPVQGFIPPIQPFNDDTTMKVSYPAYSPSDYKEAKSCPGNPCGIKWGLNLCRHRQKMDNCLPRFPAPYGHPLKPFNCQHCQCPCGPFDDRSSYNQDFRFRTQQQVEEEEEERCRKINVPPGVSLYRFDFVRSGGKKAAIMPPPIDKGHRSMHPCSIRDLNSLTRLSFRDFWKTMDKTELEMYRGKPVIRTRRLQEQNCQQNDCCEGGIQEEEQQIIYQPIYIRQPKKRCPCQQHQEKRRMRRNEQVTRSQQKQQSCLPQIPCYSGQDILNRAKTTLVCDGHDGR